MFFELFIEDLQARRIHNSGDLRGKPSRSRVEARESTIGLWRISSLIRKTSTNCNHLHPQSLISGARTKNLLALHAHHQWHCLVAICLLNIRLLHSLTDVRTSIRITGDPDTFFSSLIIPPAWQKTLTTLSFLQILLKVLNW